MNVLLLCGVFGEENEIEVISQAKRPVEFSANLFQQKLLKGFLQCDCTLRVISAPFIGSFPNASKTFYFKQFKNRTNGVQTISFCNVWGLRNFSRASSLKKKIREFIEAEDEEKLIVVYSPHTPFMEAAVYAKNRDHRIKICLVVPDLPQYMNLNENISRVYKFAKKFDIQKFNRLNKFVDSYVLLTEHMKDIIDTHGAPYIVAEGIIDTSVQSHRFESDAPEILKESHLSYILYTGKMNVRFGVKDLVDAFNFIKDERYRLVLCGTGDCDDYIFQRQAEDPRIIYLGQVSPKVARAWMNAADILVNPRKNDEIYTRYSFPSKIIDYLLSGRKVISYYLDGMPERYKSFLFIPKDNSVQSLAELIIDILNSDNMDSYNSFIDYAYNFLSCDVIASKILAM